MQKRRISKRREKRINSKKTNIGLLAGILLSILIFVFLFMFWRVYDIDKFTYVNKTTDGSAEIIIIDPSSDSVIKYLIPSDTQLSSSREYGNYKVSSLWNLSEKDGNDGKLVAETITKNYFIPISLWKDNKKGNLNIYQKIKASLILGKKNNYTEVFDSFKLSNSVLVNFVNAEFLEKIPSVDVEDLTGSYDTAEKVSKIVEIMGGKITLNSKGYDENLDCIISSKNIRLGNIFAGVFNCKVAKDETLSTDIKISLGAKFVERF